MFAFCNLTNCVHFYIYHKHFFKIRLVQNCLFQSFSHKGIKELLLKQSIIFYSRMFFSEVSAYFEYIKSQVPWFFKHFSNVMNVKRILYYPTIYNLRQSIWRLLFATSENEVKCYCQNLRNLRKKKILRFSLKSLPFAVGYPWSDFSKQLFLKLLRHFQFSSPWFLEKIISGYKDIYLIVSSLSNVINI